MNDLIFYALIIALLYYFLAYLPQQKAKQPSRVIIPTPPTNSQSTQTDSLIQSKPTTSANNTELTQALIFLLNNLKTLNQTI